MKKALYLGTTVLVIALSFTSCKKEWHCTCTYNNNIMFTKDLMNDTKKNAEKSCSAYDTTVTGTTWNCTIY